MTYKSPRYTRHCIGTKWTHPCPQVRCRKLDWIDIWPEPVMLFLLSQRKKKILQSLFCRTSLCSLKGVCGGERHILLPSGTCTMSSPARDQKKFHQHHPISWLKSGIYSEGRKRQLGGKCRIRVGLLLSHAWQISTWHLALKRLGQLPPENELRGWRVMHVAWLHIMFLSLCSGPRSDQASSFTQMRVAIKTHLGLLDGGSHYEMPCSQRPPNFFTTGLKHASLRQNFR